MKVRLALVITVALLWIAFQSAIGGYIHGNSLGQIVANHMPLGGFFFFLITLIFIINPLINWLRNQIGLSASEIALIWIMLTAASAVPGYGLMEFLFPYLSAPLYFTSPENQWAEVIIPKLPRWSYLSDKRAVKDFFAGNSEVPWKEWFTPAGFWIAFSLIFFFAFVCWAVILRKQWIERERYVFPLVQVPVQLIQAKPLFKSQLFWLGTSIAFLAHLMNGLKNYFPGVPGFRLAYSLDSLFPDKPWNALVHGWPLMALIYFSVIGVTYFLQLDVALSLWFFFTFYKFQQVLFSAFSITGVSTQHQVMGGDIVLISFLLWSSRHHLKDVLGKTLFNFRTIDDSDEPLPYKFAAYGMLASFVAIFLMCLALGMSWWISIAFIFLMWTMATVVAWMVANAGMLLVNVGFTPFWFLTTFLGSRRIDPTSLVILSFDRSSIPHWSSESLMPYALQNFRLSDMVGVEKRRVPGLMMIGIIFAVLVSFVSSLKFIYGQGGENLEYWIYMGVGRWSLEQANYAIQFPYGPNRIGIYGSLLGAGFTFFLLYMRHRFLWWPFHPIGYLVGVEYASFHLWFSTMVGWFIKALILKFGGLRRYRLYRPLFLGLIVGEYFMVAFWSFVGIFTKIGYWGLPH